MGKVPMKDKENEAGVSREGLQASFLGQESEGKKGTWTQTHTQTNAKQA